MVDSSGIVIKLGSKVIRNPNLCWTWHQRPNHSNDLTILVVPPGNEYINLCNGFLGYMIKINYFQIHIMCRSGTHLVGPYIVIKGEYVMGSHWKMVIKSWHFVRPTHCTSWISFNFKQMFFKSFYYVHNSCSNMHGQSFENCEPDLKAKGKVQGNNPYSHQQPIWLAPL